MRKTSDSLTQSVSSLKPGFEHSFVRDRHTSAPCFHTDSIAFRVRSNESERDGFGDNLLTGENSGEQGGLALT